MGLLCLLMGLLPLLIGLFLGKKIVGLFGCSLSKVAWRKMLPQASYFERLVTESMPSQLRALAATLRRDKKLSERWILDTGASFHVACNLKSFEDLEPQETPNYFMLLPNGEHLPTVGRGSVMTERFKIPNVCYVPGVKFNIITVRQLFDDHKLSVTFYHDRCYVRNRSSNIVRYAVLDNGNFLLHYLRIEQLHISVGKIYANIAAHPYNRSLFYMDSGAGSHVTPDRDLLQAYIEHDDPMFPDQFHGGQLVCADGKILAIRGIGNIDTGAIKLEDVLHVPGMVANLVSVGFLINQLNQQLQGHGEAAVTFFGSRFIVHIFGGGMQNLLGDGTAGLGNNIYLLNVLQQL